MAAVSERPGPWQKVPEIEDLAYARAERAHIALVSLCAAGQRPPPPPWRFLPHEERRHLADIEIAVLSDDSVDTRIALTRVLAEMVGWLPTDDRDVSFFWRKPSGGSWRLQALGVDASGVMYMRSFPFPFNGDDAMEELRAAISRCNAVQASTPRVTK